MSFSFLLMQNFFWKVSDEHGGRFYQDVAEIEKMYQGKWSVNSLEYYCWIVMIDERNAHHRRACKRKSF